MTIPVDLEALIIESVIKKIRKATKASKASEATEIVQTVVEANIENHAVEVNAEVQFVEVNEESHVVIERKVEAKEEVKVLASVAAIVVIKIVEVK